MENSFKVRVDKVFGSLLGSIPPRASPWTLSDAEVERKEWIQGKNRNIDSPDREDAPCSSAFEGFFSNERTRGSNSSRGAKKRFEDDLDDLGDDDDDDDGGDRTAENEGDNERDEWEIRNSVGLDSTLDNEDEEDEYDKVAVGRENAGDRVYMRDVTDYGPYLNSHNILPDSFEEIKNANKDPRANLLAAKARLQEDNSEADKSFYSHLIQAEASEDGGAAKSMLQDDDNEVDRNFFSLPGQGKAAEDGGNVKSILKRKDHQVDSRSKKRVRFDTGCKDEQDKEHVDDFLKVTQSMKAATVAETSSIPPEDAPTVPDYIRNPSKYTRYTFDTSDEDDDASNLHAFEDFQNMVKASPAHAEPQLELDCATVSLPKSVAFTPRKKLGETTGMGNGSESKLSHGDDDAYKETSRRAAYPMVITAGEEDSEACAMEEDDMETSKEEGSGGFRKVERQYRSKVNLDDSNS